MPASQLLTAAVAFAAAAAANAAPRALEKMILADFVHERSVHNPHFFTWEEQNDPVLKPWAALPVGSSLSRGQAFQWVMKRGFPGGPRRLAGGRHSQISC